MVLVLEFRGGVLLSRVSGESIASWSSRWARESRDGGFRELWFVNLISNFAKVDMEKPPMLLNPSVLELDPMATNVSTSFRPVSIIRSKVVVVSQSFLAGVGI